MTQAVNFTSVKPHCAGYRPDTLWLIWTNISRGTGPFCTPNNPGSRGGAAAPRSRHDTPIMMTTTCI
jgi:hypothetical protein